jgi:hypothetical protein
MSVLIGCPTWKGKAYCLDTFADHIKKLTSKDFSLMVVDNSPDSSYQALLRPSFSFLPEERLIMEKIPYLQHAKDRIVKSRNWIRSFFLHRTYDHFLSLEQDVLPPPHLIELLLSHKKDVVSALVWNSVEKEGKQIAVPMLYEERDHSPGKLFYIDPQKIQNPGLYEVAAASLSCMLISRQVLEKVAFRYERGFDDMAFCRDARKEGFQVFADTTVVPEHQSRPWTGILK